MDYLLINCKKILSFSLIAFLLLPLVIVQAQTPQKDAEVLINELNRGFIGRMLRGGVNEERVFQVLRNKDDRYRRQLEQEYLRRTGRSLRQDLRKLGRDNGSDVIKGRLLLDQGWLTPVDEIFLAIRGGGTNEEQLRQILDRVPRGPQQGQSMEREWREKYGPNGSYYQWDAPTLRAALTSEFSMFSGPQRDEILGLYDEIWSPPPEQATPLGRRLEQEGIRGQESTLRLSQGLPPTQSVRLPTARPLPPADCGPRQNGSYHLCVKLPGQPQNVGGFEDYIRLLYQFALAIAGVIALGRIVYGGIMYTFSAGNTAKQKDAATIITQAIWGLVLLLSAVLILYTINPQLLQIRFSTQPLFQSNKGLFDFIQVAPPQY